MDAEDRTASTGAVARAKRAARRQAKPFRLSIVIPCYNEQEVIELCWQRIADALGPQNLDFEVIFVNDGSKDATAALISAMRENDPRVKLISLSRNFGHQVALTAGLDHANGDCVVIMDADLQDPPELLPRMVELWRDGYDIVYGKRGKRTGETWLKVWCTNFYYKHVSKLTEVPFPEQAGDFRLMDRRAILALRRMRERHRLLRGMTSWAGYDQIDLPYERPAREAGVTKYPYHKLVTLAMDGILSFTVLPLKIITVIGAVTFLCSILYILYAVAVRLLTNDWVQGWTLLIVAVMFFGSIQFLALGIVGEYIGRIYNEVKNRPLYFIDWADGIDLNGPDRQD